MSDIQRILEMLIAYCFVGFTASGCIDSEYRGLNPVGGGYVVDVDENGWILVVSSERKKVGGSEDYYEAIRYAPPEDQESVEVGQEVNVWMDQHDGIQESYPAQASAAKIDVHEDPHPEGADYARSEAVRQALQSLGQERSAPVVLNAEYSVEGDVWTVNLLDDRRDPVEVKVADQG